MKKQLLLGSALLAAITAYPQNGRLKPTSKVNVKTGAVANLFAIEPTQAPKLNTPAQPAENTPSEDAKSSSVQTFINWKLLCGSMNTYGMLVSRQHALEYNDAVDAISFIHRKSTSYTAIPSGNSNSGTIVAEISSNWGTSFDSTCIYADASNAGRYPQGGIYSAPGNTNIANAYVVGSGPVVTGSAFTGDWYASKQIGTPGSTVFTNAPSTVPNAQQYVPFNVSSYPANFQPHSWSRCGFAVTDDGLVRSLAMVQNDNSTIDPRGFGVVKGVFNAGVFSWTMDTLIPNTTVDASGSKNLGEGSMAWNESGSVGYVVAPGILTTASGNNQGIQPIIWKTTNNGASWAQVQGIDFNNSSMANVVNHLYSTSANTAVAIPYFIDWNIAVDANNKLHIGALLASASSADPDSAYYLQQVQVGTGVYKWGHGPGDRPYLYDFVGDGTGPWSVMTIDSMSSEDPGAATTSAGYNENPWDPTGTNSAKLNIDPRIQLGRTPNGQAITFSWTESDTAFTNQQMKYNTLPNIKARMVAIGSSGSMTISPTEINVTKPAAGQGSVNPGVNTRATLHYMSPTTNAGTVFVSPTTSTVDVMVPFTVTNSNPYSQLTNNTTWFSGARLSFAFNSVVSIGTTTIAGLAEHANSVYSNSYVYPNPAKTSATLSMDLKKDAKVTVSIFNAIGQLVKTTSVQGTMGTNKIEMDLNNLTSGVYLVNLNSEGYTATTKLIVE